jgi:antitoxin (DNA-binding transcriptional repressor) of toxin-antitoxin stability system
MISIDIRDLAANLSRYIRRLGIEQRIIVTDHGEPVAALRLPDAEPGNRRVSRYEALVAAGIVRPAIESGDPLADWPPQDRPLAVRRVRHPVESKKTAATRKNALVRTVPHVLVISPLLCATT